MAMSQSLRVWFTVLVIASVALTVGCGGSGTVGTAPDPGRVSVYVTDGFGDQYTQVMVTVYRLAVGRQGDESSFQVVFDEPAGLTMDVRALANLSQFLGIGTVPAGTYNRARLVLGDHVQLTTPSGSSQTVSLDAGVGTSLGNGQIQFEFPIQLSVQSMGNTNLVVDFDLPSFSMVNGLLRPALRHLHDDQLGNRQRYAEVKGTIAELGQNQFTIRLRNDNLVTVLTSDQTAIVNEYSGTPGTLAVGQKVEVKGTIDANTLQVNALRVKIEDTQSGSDQPSLIEAKGWVKEIGDGQFVLQVRRMSHGQMASTVTVTYDQQTVWYREHHSSAGPGDLQVGSRIEVKGVLDSTTGVLSARYIEIDD